MKRIPIVFVLFFFYFPAYVLLMSMKQFRGEKEIICNDPAGSWSVSAMMLDNCNDFIMI